MNIEKFRKIIETELAPMLSGQVGDVVPANARDQLTSYADPCTLCLRPSKTTENKIKLSRSQKFSSDEKELASMFVQELATLESFEDSGYFSELLLGLPRRVIAKYLGSGPVLLSVLEQVDSWASQTYEGQRISIAIGINDQLGGSDIKFSEYAKEDFSAVLTNGFDTMIIVGNDGNIGGFSQLPEGPSVIYAPYRLSKIATWASGNKVSIVLNRHGEILVFKGQQLRFARRRSRWYHYTHDSIIKRLSPPQKLPIRNAVYESCLDVSFGRTGGCIGILNKGSNTEGLLSPADLLASGTTIKSRLLHHSIEKPFHELDRRLRQELMAIDGAVILNYKGKIITAGAIIQVAAGSEGGGRLSAAKKLGEYGIGVKISADGPIHGFRGDKEVFTF